MDKILLIQYIDSLINHKKYLIKNDLKIFVKGHEYEVKLLEQIKEIILKPTYTIKECKEEWRKLGYHWEENEYKDIFLTHTTCFRPQNDETPPQQTFQICIKTRYEEYFKKEYFNHDVHYVPINYYEHDLITKTIKALKKEKETNETI